MYIQDGLFKPPRQVYTRLLSASAILLSVINVPLKKPWKACLREIGSTLFGINIDTKAGQVISTKKNGRSKLYRYNTTNKY
jgi:hypothetical protein